jgi:hypothetical protein
MNIAEPTIHALRPEGIIDFESLKTVGVVPTVTLDKFFILFFIDFFSCKSLVSLAEFYHPAGN